MTELGSLEGAPLVPYLYHPTYFSRDRRATAKWLEQVFGRTGVYQGEAMGGWDHTEGWVADYSYFLWISNLWLDVVQPDLYPAGASTSFDAGVGKWAELGWYTKDPQRVFTNCRNAGIRMLDAGGSELTGDKLPAVGSPVHDDLVLFWLDSRDVGLSMEVFWKSDEQIRKTIDTPGMFDRYRSDWTRPPVADDDPLALVGVAHHTIVTGDLQRSLRGAAAAFEGVVTGTARDEFLNADITSVVVGDSLLRYAVPTGPGRAQDALQTPGVALTGQRQLDTLYDVAFVSADLSRARGHLASIGVATVDVDPSRMLIESAPEPGMRWEFIAD